MSQSRRPANRLWRETSPYLLQHQHNPVDWFAWGDEAFKLARDERKPIFLSVGYSSCYWCHVMERESFENDDVARMMNEHFINIKLDREERPDIDQLYMTAVQLLTGQGGWPMSLWLTPDLKPLYGGTYFPPDDRHGRPGFLRLCEAVGDAWKNRREQVEQQADQIVDAMKKLSAPSKRNDDSISFDIVRLIEQSVHDFDPRHGGFGHAPKFPRQTLLTMLLDALESPRDELKSMKPTIESMLTRTLDAMADGGIHDHLGGAFHRYSTDAKWLVPHFEIMLYDQAMLAPIYARASRLLKNDRYQRVARGVCDFVLREMRSDDGAFFSAFDAEANAREGSTYLWTEKEIDELLGGSSRKFKDVYGIELGNNFTDPHHDQGLPSANVLYLPRGADLENDLDLIAARTKLLQARNRRAQPSLDRKVLTAWNALMIEALAICSIELNEPGYREAAMRCAGYLLKNHVQRDADLLHSSFAGLAKGLGNLDDYSFIINALLTLSDTTNDRRWHDAASRLAVPMIQRFSDDGAMFFSDERADDLIIRQKVTTDSPLPSGNAIAARGLMKLGRTTIARSILADCSDLIHRSPESHSSMISCLIELESSRSKQIESSIPANDQHLQIEAARTGPRRIDVVVKIPPGFHIYHFDLDPRHGLTATRLHLQGGALDSQISIEYPSAKLLELPYGPQVAGYTDRIEIIVRSSEILPEKPIDLSLSYQLCDDRTCQRPSVARTSV